MTNYAVSILHLFNISNQQQNKSKDHCSLNRSHIHKHGVYHFIYTIWLRFTWMVCLVIQANKLTWLSRIVQKPSIESSQWFFISIAMFFSMGASNLSPSNLSLSKLKPKCELRNWEPILFRNILKACCTYLVPMDGPSKD